jgi:hypothetical protein
MTEGSGKLTNLIAVRLDEERLRKLKAWRKEQDDPPNNAEAIRQLFDLGLEAWTRGERPGPARSSVKKGRPKKGGKP